MTKATSGTKCTFPLSSFPSKLLLLIFQTLVDDMYCDDDGTPRLDCFVLANVCQMWRSIVLSTPRFWTRLHMVIWPRAISCDQLEASIKRSANAPLDIVIYIPLLPPWSYSGGILSSTPGPLPSRIRACFKALRDCSHRWRSLRIRVLKQELDYSVTNCFNLVLSELSLAHAPTLHDVEIICPSGLRWVTFVEKPFQLLSTSHSPLLKKLTLEGCDSKILPPHVNLSSLTHLSLNFVMEYNDVQNSHLAFRNILSSAQSIVSLEVHQRVFRVGHAETSGDLSPVTLVTLRTLSIFMNTEKPAYLGNILRTIAAPNLLHFALHNDSLVRGESSHLDFSFLSQNKMPIFPSVRKLTMMNVLQSAGGPGKNIHCIFTAFPHVTDVVLDNDIREIANYLAHESYDRKAPPLWPYLGRLTIEMPIMITFHYLQHLIEWLRLRRARLPLPTVIIQYGFHGPAANDSRDLTAIKRIVNDATGYRASDTKWVLKQLGKLGALVDLRVADEKVSCRHGKGSQALCQYHFWTFRNDPRRADLWW